MDSPIICAVAGLGRIGSTLERDPLREKPASHAGAISGHPKAVLAAGADPDPQQREAFRADWPDARVYDDAARMLATEKPVIFHIAAWTDTHPDLLQAAIDAEIPVVVCEKPLANSVRSARPLRRALRGSRTRVVMNHERRFSRDYRAVHDMIRSKVHGELLSISARLYMGRSRPAGRLLYHDGTHMLDILRYLTGEELRITHVDGRADRAGDGLMISLLAGSIPVSLDASGGRDHLEFSLDLSFTSGRVRIGNGIFEIWESEESPHYTGFRSLIKTRDSWEGETGYFSGMMAHAVSLAENPDLPSESDLDDGFAVLVTIRDILRRSRQSGLFRLFGL